MITIPVVTATNITNLRKNLKDNFNKVTKENKTLIVTRNNEPNVVIVSEKEFSEMIKEINNLQYNLKLLKSIQEAESRDFVEVTIDELGTYE